jgi:hypothetical protein
MHSEQNMINFHSVKSRVTLTLPSVVFRYGTFWRAGSVFSFDTQLLVQFMVLCHSETYTWQSHCLAAEKNAVLTSGTSVDLCQLVLRPLPQTRQTNPETRYLCYSSGISGNNVVS